MPAAQATTVSYAQVGFAGLWGWLLFGEPVALPTVAGAALILSSILLSRGRLPDAPQARLRARAPRSNADHGDEAGDG
jgi:drug/metabolite transporter (DMT)-like permease